MLISCVFVTSAQSKTCIKLAERSSRIFISKALYHAIKHLPQPKSHHEVLSHILETPRKKKVTACVVIYRPCGPCNENPKDIDVKRTVRFTRTKQVEIMSIGNFYFKRKNINI